jgi:thymidylate synthase
MRIATGVVSESTLSDAWLNTLVQVADTPDRKLFHMVTRITEPTTEDAVVRAAADDLLAAFDYQPIETVANTVFPLELAQSSRDAGHLGQRYRAMYPTIRRVHKSNRRGTYFGRLVAYPTANGDLDQLSTLIRKLRQELDGDRPKGARYEVPITSGVQDPDEPDPGLLEDDYTAAVPIHAAGRDTSPMDFPCLSFCSFQLDHEQIHLTAHYRSQYLVQRGYGNYLGLARLQAYVAHAADVEPGQLLVVAGLAHADAAKYRVQQVVAAAQARERQD